MACDRHGRTRAARRALLAAASILAGGCAHANGAHASGAREGSDEASTRAAITLANAEFARALERGDAQAMAALFTEDAEVIPAMQRGVISGRAAIESYNASRMGARRYVEVAITTAHVGVSGDLAWETGTSRVAIQHGESAPVTLTGRYLAVWKREADGRWRIRAELPVPDPVP
jgi:uncharacterized protein (TIGR02246 family)